MLGCILERLYHCLYLTHTPPGRQLQLVEALAYDLVGQPNSSSTDCFRAKTIYPELLIHLSLVG